MKTIFGPADVARHLGVRPPALSNWLRRYPDTPKPAYRTPGGRMFWTSLAPWITWHAARQSHDPLYGWDNDDDERRPNEDNL